MTAIKKRTPLLFIITLLSLLQTISFAQNTQLVLPNGHKGTVTALAYSQNGKWIASGGDDNTIKLWDAENGKLVKTFFGHALGISAIAFSPDDQWLVSGGKDNYIYLWDIESGQMINQLKGHTDALSDITFRMKKDRTLMSVNIIQEKDFMMATSSWDGSIILWDLLAEDPKIAQWHAHQGGAQTITFAHKGKWLVSGGGDAAIRVWSVKDTTQLFHLRGHLDWVSDIESFQEDLLVSASWDGSVCVWDLEERGILHRKRNAHLGGVAKIAVHETSNKLLTIGRDHKIEMWTADSLHHANWRGAYEYVNPVVTFSPFGGEVGVSIEEGSFVLMNTVSGKVVKEFKGVNEWITAMDIASSNGWVSLGGNEGKLSLWHSASNDELYILNGHQGKITEVAFSKGDYPFIISSSEDSTIRVWNAKDASLVKVLKQESAVNTVTFSESGKLFASGGEDGSLVLWDFDSLWYAGVFPFAMESILSLDFTKDDRYLASAGKDRAVRIWDTQTGQLVQTLKGHAHWIESVKFSNDGQFVLSGSRDGKINVWNWQDSVLTGTFDKHGSAVLDLQVSHSGHKIISSAENGTVLIWDYRNFLIEDNLTSSNNAVTSVKYFPDNRSVLTAGKDNALRIWDTYLHEERGLVTLIGDSGWMILMKNGLFDASPKAMDQLYYVSGLEEIDLDQLKDLYWEPGLAEKLYEEEDIRYVPPLDSIPLHPSVDLSIQDEELVIDLENRGGGIGEVSLLINGKELLADARGGKLNENRKKGSINIPLDELSQRWIYGQENEVEVRVKNTDGTISSRGIGLKYVPQGKKSNHAVHFYAVVVGVSDYRGSSLDLKFAGKDAIDIGEAMKVAASSLFGQERVHIRVFSTEEESDALPPTKENIRQALKDYSERAMPEDILMVYCAGHGQTFKNIDQEDFYFLTQDMLDGDMADSFVRENYSIAGKELIEWIKEINASKQVLILDACHAGQLSETIVAMRSFDEDATRVRSLERLKDRTGMHVLAGAAADKVSYESSAYGQGLLTYALLDYMKNGLLRKDEFIDVSAFFQYAVDKVPVLAKGIGGIQTPQLRVPDGGESFDIGRLNVKDREMINLAYLKPRFIPSYFERKDSWIDDLQLSYKVNQQLTSISERGGEEDILFTHIAFNEGAYVLRGKYEDDEQGRLVVQARLYKGFQMIDEFTVSGQDLNLIKNQIIQQALSNIQ